MTDDETDEGFPEDEITSSDPELKPGMYYSSTHPTKKDIPIENKMSIILLAVVILTGIIRIALYLLKP